MLHFRESNDKNIENINKNSLFEIKENNKIKKNREKKLILLNNLVSIDKFQPPLLNIINIIPQDLINIGGENIKSRIDTKEYKTEGNNDYRHNDSINNKKNKSHIKIKNNDKLYNIKSKTQLKKEKNVDINTKNDISKKIIL